jgi:phosphoribosylformylglycinamidine (FGAM) synthase PurS component
MNQHTLINLVWKKFALLRIRAKISYMAFLKKQTIQELLINSIIHTYQSQIEDGDIKITKEKYEEDLLQAT